MLWNTRAKDENGNNIFIPVTEAESYLTEEFCSAYEVYRMTENLGCLPFAGGWAEQPAWIARALSVLKVERTLLDEEERQLKQEETESTRKYGK